jgi:hypothetical protein
MLKYIIMTVEHSCDTNTLKRDESSASCSDSFNPWWLQTQYLFYRISVGRQSCLTVIAIAYETKFQSFLSCRVGKTDWQTCSSHAVPHPSQETATPCMYLSRSDRLSASPWLPQLPQLPQLPHWLQRFWGQTRTNTQWKKACVTRDRILADSRYQDT